MSLPAIALQHPRVAVRHAPRAPRLRVVETPSATRTGHMSRLLWVLAVVVVCALIATVGFHVVLVQSQFEIDDLRGQAAAEEHRYERARLQVAQLASPARVVARAHELGMVAATEVPTVVGVPAVPSESLPADGTATTLSESWPRVKPYLAAQP